MLNEAELQDVFTALRQAREAEVHRLQYIRSWLRGEVNDIYRPEDSSEEYKALVDRSKFNLLRLVVTTVAQNLFIDGYRPSVEAGSGREVASGADSDLWRVWQANRMDSRQAQVWRPAITYGTSYVSVLPARLSNEDTPKLKPYSPWRCTALYEDPEDDAWPVYAMTTSADYPFARVDQLTARVMGAGRIRIWDENHVYTMAPTINGSWAPELGSVEEHGLGKCPIVRFRKVDDDGSASLGKIEPLIDLQKQINQTTFSLMMTQHFASFKQRWATGMEIEEDDDGNPVSPFISRVDALWQNDSPDGRFGEFAESPLDPYLNSRDKAILGMSSMGQVPPHNLLVGNGISNIAAETLAALESAHRHDIGDYQTGLGESAEQMMTLAGQAMGDRTAAEDEAAEVVWRDTTPRSLGQLIDAFVKMAAGLGVPVEALWERIPGVTDQEITYWKSLAASGDLLSELSAMMGEDDAVTAGPGVDEAVPPSADSANGAGVPPSAAAAAFG